MNNGNLHNTNTTEAQADVQSAGNGLSWKTALIYAALAVFAGGGGGAGLIASKVVAQNPTTGLTQDQADVRYQSKDSSENARKTGHDEMKDLRKDMLTREVYEAYRRADVERMDRMEKTLERIADNQNR